MSVFEFPFDPKFRFDVAQFRAAVCEPISVPSHVNVRITVDPAYFANPDSDESALCAAFLDDVEDMRVLTILDAASGRWPGLTLPDQIVAMAEKWMPADIRVESTGNGAPELLKTVCQLRAEMKGVTLGPITLFHPNNKIAAKRCRIFKLQSLVESTPPAIRICDGSYVPQLMRQLQNFCFDNDQNHRREDGLIDVISLAAGF